MILSIHVYLDLDYHFHNCTEHDFDLPRVSDT